MAYPLEPSPEDMREMGEAALSFAVDFLRSLPDAPAVNLEGALEAALAVREPPPEEGGDFGSALDLVSTAARKAMENAGPGYIAYVPGGGLFTAAVADFLACVIDRFANLWASAPVAAQIEYNVVRWVCDLFGYPQESRGVLTSGGSVANLSAIVTARRAKLGEDFMEGTLYVSDQVHASVTKAAAIAGLPERSIRTVATTPMLRMDVDHLRDMIRADRDAGLRPFLVVASAGTVNTGAVDPLADIAEVAAEDGLWLHADAAYGGFFQLTERGRERFRGIERADSITLDPHKGMFLPYGTGSLVVRDGARLRDAHYSGAHYLQDLADEDVIPNFTEYSPELSRDFRGLRVWLPLKLHGVSAFREALDEKLDLAGLLYQGLRDIPELELPWEPELTVVPFRLHGEGPEVDAANQRLLERINASKRVFMSSTVVNGGFVIRPCILSHRTHRDRIDEAIDIVRRSVAAVV